jgi:hypothetical protein
MVSNEITPVNITLVSLWLCRNMLFARTHISWIIELSFEEEFQREVQGDI